MDGISIHVYKLYICVATAKRRYSVENLSYPDVFK